MEHLPGNSHISRENKEEPKKVIEGIVKRRKTPLGKKFYNVFLGGDAREASSYVLFEVLIPAARDVLVEVFSQLIDRTINGEGRPGVRRPGSRLGGDGRISYNRFSAGSIYNRREEPRNISYRARATHDFDEIILDTRVEAQTVLDQLYHIVTKYGSATVADLYNLVGITGKYTDDKYGWTDIQGAGITRIKSGYLLDMPRPEQLD